MSRRKAATKRVILPDPLFGSELIAKFINVVMRCGKKSVAEKIVYGALETISSRKTDTKEEKETSSETKKESKKTGSIRTNAEVRKAALDVFTKCLDVLRPTVEVRSRRVGGANYQVPVEVRTDRGIALAMRWLVEFANNRTEKTMALRLANEILDVLGGKGGSVKKRETVHSMAKANQAFAHFRW